MKAPETEETVCEAAQSDMGRDEAPSVSWRMRRRGWAAVRTDSAGDVLTVWFAYVTQFITKISSVYGLCSAQ